MQKKSDLALRLKALRKEKNVKSEDVANAIGIKSATYRTYEVKTKPKAPVYIALAKYFGVSVDYLMSGKDNLSLSVADPGNYDTCFQYELTAEEASLIKKLRTLNSDAVQEVINFVDWKCENGKKN